MCWHSSHFMAQSAYDQAKEIDYGIIAVVSMAIMSVLGTDFDTSVGAVAATLGNIGPGIGGVGPALNFSEIHVVGKWFLSFLMLVGRLELFTVLVLFSPLFWKR